MAGRGEWQEGLRATSSRKPSGMDATFHRVNPSPHLTRLVLGPEPCGTSSCSPVTCPHAL